MVEDDSPVAAVAHGICSECVKQLLRLSEVNLSDVLDSIDVPIIVTDAAMTLLLVNQKAKCLLGNSAYQLEMPTVGIAIECRNAGLLGSCGEGEPCAGCILRRAIRDTRVDGRRRYGVYSDLEVAMTPGTEKKRFRFSTTRMGDAIVLAIDGIVNLATESHPVPRETTALQ